MTNRRLRSANYPRIKLPGALTWFVCVAVLVALGGYTIGVDGFGCAHAPAGRDGWRLTKK